MSRKYISIPTLLTLLFFATPSAALSAEPQSFAELLEIFIDIAGYSLAFIYVLAIFSFVYGISQFIMNAENEAKRKDGKQWMFWSVITLFVSITLWGIVAVFSGTFQLGPIFIPQLPG